MFDLLDDPAALAPASAQHRADVISRGTHLRRRRHTLQVGATALVVLLVVGLFTAFAPRLTRDTPQPASPNGEGAWIAYQRHGAIYLTRPDGTESHPIFLPPHRYAGAANWSPDGSDLLVVLYDSNHSAQPVVAVDPGGSQVRRLFQCDYCLEAVWSPDGRKVAYSELGRSQSIRVYDLDRQTSRVIAHVSTDRGLVDSLSWAPDAKALVFGLSKSPEFGVRVTGRHPDRAQAVAVVDVPPTGQGEVRVITDPDLRAADPDWSPDGSRIVFAANPVNRSGGDLHSRWCDYGCSGQNLYTMNPDGSDIKALTSFVGESQLGYDDTLMSASQPRWSTDGRQVLFTVSLLCRGDPTCLGHWRTGRTRQPAFIGSDGSGLTVLPVTGVNHPDLRPVDGP